jgi:hypothetical protein
MREREQLINELVDDLSVKPKQMSIFKLALLWWAGTWAYVVLATLALGPLRSTVMHEINHNHHFQIESLTGLVASLLIALVAWYGSVPGALNKKLLVIGSALFVAWISFYVVGYFFEPALEPSMLGKRVYCYLEAFVCSFPPTLIACYQICKRFPLKLKQTGLLIGLAAGMIPALFMQFACMYEPTHILTHHILPGLINGIIGLVSLVLMQRYLNKPVAV